MTSRRSRSFGAAAATYERYRPDYPDAVVQLIQDYAGRPIRSALELGAGTGKATRVFARHGIAVTASEPDEEMLAELRTAVPGARTVTAPLESLPPIGPFDLVVVAAALHWTEPAGRWDRIAGLLVPGGVFANFGGPPYLADPDLENALQSVERRWIDDAPAGPTEMSADGLHWPATELMDDVRFADIRELTVERQWSMPASDWIGYLSTVSAYLVLSETDRTTALDAISDVLPDIVEVRADLTLHLARRV